MRTSPLRLVMLPALLVVLGLPGPSNVPAEKVTPTPERHDFHVSYGRLAVEGQFAVCNIRFFRDDLEQGLAAFGEQPGFVMNVSPDADALFLRYLNERFSLIVSDETLEGTIIGSGEDVEGKEAIWWYTIQYTAPGTIETFHLENLLLIEQFEEQKNIVKVQHFPSEKTLSYYFDEKDTAFDIAI